MASSSDIRMGPWSDGINLLDEPDQLQDRQMLSCINLDVDNTGVLEPRRGLRYSPIDSTANIKYLMATVILAGETQPRALTSTYDGTNSAFRALSTPTSGAAFTNLAAGQYYSAVQYQNKIWYIPGVSTTIGRFSPSSTTNNPMTTVGAMPYGDYGFILKDRLFIVRKATSELFFSKATDFTIWAAPDGGVIQVNPGDSAPITKVVTVNNQVIIFKRDSTFVLSFNTSPTGDGVLRQVASDQGALDAITYNNEVYTYNSRSVFKFVNGFYQDIGLQLNLAGQDVIDSAVSNPARLNVVGKTLILGTTPGGKTYAMNLDTNAWSTYTLASDLSISTGTIFSRSSVGTAVFFGDGTSKISFMLLARTQRTDQSVDLSYKAPAYSFKTKEYNFDDSEVWKRMYSYHLDTRFDASVVGNALTFINGVQNTSSPDPVDFVGSFQSFRFKTVAIGYSAPSIASTADALTGLLVRGIRAVVGIKAPVSI